MSYLLVKHIHSCNVHVALMKNINLYVYLHLLTLKFAKYKQHALMEVLVSFKEFRNVRVMYDCTNSFRFH
jgi:hypothetical protein